MEPFCERRRIPLAFASAGTRTTIWPFIEENERGFLARGQLLRERGLDLAVHRRDRSAAAEAVEHDVAIEAVDVDVAVHVGHVDVGPEGC